MKLKVQDKIGQRLYMDGKLVGTNKYDHSDFHGKNTLIIGHGHHRTMIGGEMKNIFYRKI